MSKKNGNWQTLASEIVHKNPYYSVRQDEVIKPDGSKGFYNVVDAPGSVFIVALDDEQMIYLVVLHRYPNSNLSIEIPAGGVDDDDPLTAAKRELAEETSLQAANLKELGVIFPANGLLAEKNYVFLATGLSSVEINMQAEEGIIEIRRVTIKDALLMIKSGEINDTQSIAAITMALLELNYI